MAREDIEWIPPGFRKEEDAWKKAVKDFPPDHELLVAAQKMGLKLKIGVKQSGSKYYVCIIRQI